MEYMDCIISTGKDSIEIYNSRIYRRWELRNGLCHAASLKDIVTGKEYILETGINPAPSPDFEVKGKCVNVSFEKYIYRDSIVEEESLRLEVVSEFEGYKLITHFKIYPDAPAVSQWISAKGDVPEMEESTKPVESVDNIENLRAFANNSMNIRGLGDMLVLDRVHKKLGVVDFMAHTDRKDNLCSWKEDILTIHSTYAYSSNLFYFHDQLDNNGLLFLKEAPLPHARPVKADYDLMVDGGNLYLAGHGTSDLTEYPGYPFTVILYSGGSFGRMKALHEYQRKFRLYNEKRDDVIWHSTWGDRNADKIISSEFMLKELEDMKIAGGDFLFFDDGWQKGAAMTPLTMERYIDQWSKPGYWDVDKDKFPNDITEVTQKADEYGMMKGLWFCPDQTNDYENYKKDIEVLLNLYKNYGFGKVKIDAIAIRSKLGEKRIR
ncbi:MAG: alpha-galactosidase, partial [Clostridia bacterium]|nr:alpha-galactosidase [Clostridia bacterium]